VKWLKEEVMTYVRQKYPTLFPSTAKSEVLVDVPPVHPKPHAMLTPNQAGVQPHHSGYLFNVVHVLVSLHGRTVKVFMQEKENIPNGKQFTFPQDGPTTAEFIIEKYHFGHVIFLEPASGAISSYDTYALVRVFDPAHENEPVLPEGQFQLKNLVNSQAKLGFSERKWLPKITDMVNGLIKSYFTVPHFAHPAP
jgi:hypothetical protein